MMCLRISQKVHVAYNFNYHVHYKCGNISETVHMVLLETNNRK